MQAKRKVVFFVLLLLLSMLMGSVKASTNTTVSLHGVGVTIDLIFPEEAHPNDNVTYTATLRANTGLTLNNLTLVIKVPINSTLQEITGWYLFNRVLQANESRMEEITFNLDSNANGMIQCFIFIDTTQNTDYLSTMFYTTLVSEPTFSEMRVLYYEILANYTSLQANYEALLEEYNGLLANYSSLLTNYTALLTEYDILSGSYDNQVGLYDNQVLAYEKKLKDYNDLLDDYNNLDNDFESKSNDFQTLNETHYELQANYTSLETNFEDLNALYTSLFGDFEKIQGEVNSDKIVMIIFVISCIVLIAFIVYLKRKKEDPYLVIRKETVSMKSDKET